jgi:cyclic 2,3-diphosphoglycerate synthetase
VDNSRVDRGPVIALVDGEHHPATVRDALAGLDAERKLAGVIFCGGEEKVRREVLEDPEAHYGFPLALDPHAALREMAGDAIAVVDLADEPVLPPAAKLRLAALALHLGLSYEAPGMRLEPPSYQHVDFAGPKLGVIGTGKRTGKTAVAGHWAALLRERGGEPVIVSMGRGGPAEPQLARPNTSLGELRAIAADGRHAASDYLEDAVLAGVPAVGCRRVGGGLAGEPFEHNVAEGAALAVSLGPDALIFEGSGACVPPVEVDRTVCIVGERGGALGELGPYRLLRADLALVMQRDTDLLREVGEICPGRTVPCELVPEPAEELPDGARVAFFTTGAKDCDGVEPVVGSTALARRSALEGDLERAAAERCDVYLVELKAAAIDTVALHAERDGARVVFLRNRPVAPDADLDSLLLELHDRA